LFVCQFKCVTCPKFTFSIHHFLNNYNAKIKEIFCSFSFTMTKSLNGKLFVIMRTIPLKLQCNESFFVLIFALNTTTSVDKYILHLKNLNGKVVEFKVDKKTMLLEVCVLAAAASIS
jgi:hypothetical protein